MVLKQKTIQVIGEKGTEIGKRQLCGNDLIMGKNGNIFVRMQDKVIENEKINNTELREIENAISQCIDLMQASGLIKTQKE